MKNDFNPFLLEMTCEINEGINCGSAVLQGNDLYERVTFFLQNYVPCMQEETDENKLDEYLRILFRNAKELDISLMDNDPYIKNISFQKYKENSILLSNASYKAYELLQYDMPLLYQDMIIPRLGYFKKEVFFPTVYEGNIPWMSVVPSEINSMKEGIQNAHGKMLVLGLGLGYMPYLSALKDEVQSIDIIEINPAVISLFEKHIHPQMGNNGKKIRVYQDDGLHYIENVKPHAYDSIFIDIYEGMSDGHMCYEKIHPFEERLKNTSFTYWIEKYIH